MTNQQGPEQTDVFMLDLVRQYGEESYQQGIAAGQRNEGGEDHYDDKARALFARIAELVPQQPVQARDGRGKPWWLHPCGYVDPDGISLDEDVCSWCGKQGSWRPLLVGGTPAPERQADADGLDYHAYQRGHYQIDGSQACAVCGGRRAAGVHRRQPDLIAQVMEALGVDRPEDVMGAIERLTEAHAFNHQLGEQWRRQRDEARAEVKRPTRDLAEAHDQRRSGDTLHVTWSDQEGGTHQERLTAPRISTQLLSWGAGMVTLYDHLDRVIGWRQFSNVTVFRVDRTMP